MILPILYRLLADSSSVGVPDTDSSGNQTSFNTNLPTVAASSDALQTVLKIVFGAIGAISLLIIIIAALQFITSGGDPQNVAKARRAILFAVAGLAIAVLAEVIVTYVIHNV